MLQDGVEKGGEGEVGGEDEGGQGRKEESGDHDDEDALALGGRQAEGTELLKLPFLLAIDVLVP